MAIVLTHYRRPCLLIVYDRKRLGIEKNSPRAPTTWLLLDVSGKAVPILAIGIA